MKPLLIIPKITAYGYRQNYSPVHFVMNPYGNLQDICEFNDVEMSNLTQNLQTILSLLVDKKAKLDLDHFGGSGLYATPPIISNEITGNRLPTDTMISLQTDLLLARASPNTIGSSGHANSMVFRKEVMRNVFQAFMATEPAK